MKKSDFLMFRIKWLADLFSQVRPKFSNQGQHRVNCFRKSSVNDFDEKTPSRQTKQKTPFWNSAVRDIERFKCANCFASIRSFFLCFWDQWARTLNRKIVEYGVSKSPPLILLNKWKFTKKTEKLIISVVVLLQLCGISHNCFCDILHILMR